MTFRISKESKKILLNVARSSIEIFLKKGKRPIFNFENDDFLKRRAVFVTLWEKESAKLRGCIGGIEAFYPLIEAVSKTAISSALEDPRFVSLKINELKNIKIEINLLSALNDIIPEEIKIGKHGLYLICGSFNSVFLPEVAVSNNWDINTFLDELSLKAGLKKEDWKKPETKIKCFESESWIEG